MSKSSSNNNEQICLNCQKVCKNLAGLRAHQRSCSKVIQVQTVVQQPIIQEPVQQAQSVQNEIVQLVQEMKQGEPKISNITEYDLQYNKTLCDLIEVLEQFPEYNVEAIKGTGRKSKTIKKTVKKDTKSVFYKKLEKQRELLKQIQTFINKRGFDGKIKIVGNQVVVGTMNDITEVQLVEQRNNGDFNPEVWEQKHSAVKRFIQRTFEFMDRNKAVLKRGGINTEEVIFTANNGKKKTFLRNGFEKVRTIKATKNVEEHQKDAIDDEIDEMMGEDVFYERAGSEIGRDVLVNLKQTLFISPMTVSRCVFDCLAIINVYKQEMSVQNIYAEIKITSDKLFKEYKKKTGENTVNSEHLVEIMEENEIPIYQFQEGCEQSIQEIGVMVYKQHCIVVLPNSEENKTFCQTIQMSYHKSVDMKMPVWQSREEKLIQIQTALQTLVDMRESEQFQECADEDQIKSTNRAIKKYQNQLKGYKENLYIMFDFEWTYKRSQLEQCAVQNKLKKQITDAVKDIEDLNERFEKRKELEEQHKAELDKIIIEKFPYAFSLTVLGTDQYDKGYFGLDCPQVCVDHLKKICEENKDKNIILYAHNCFSADLPIIKKQMLKYFRKDNTDFQSRMKCIAERYNIIYETEDGKQIDQIVQFQDTLNLIGLMTLEDIGKNYCKTFRKLDCDHNKIFLENWEQQRIEQNLDSYIMNDVLVLKEALEFLDIKNQQDYGFRLLGLNNILSLSSTSQKIMFSKYYNPEEKPMYYLPKEYEDFVRKAYGGGSCQLFFRGHIKNGHIFSIDVNSQYPAMMLKNKFPLGPYRYINMFNQKYIGQELKMGVYQVYIEEQPLDRIPFLQLKKEGQVQYKYITKQKVHITSEGIKHIFSQGTTEMYIIDGIYSEREDYFFEDFVKDLYKQRADIKREMKKYDKNSQEYSALDGLQLRYKNLLNGSYGKFGTQLGGIVSQLTTNEDLIRDLFTQGQLKDIKQISETLYQFSGVVSDKGESYSGYENVMIAAFVTEYARILLNKIQNDVQNCGFQLLYSDTDSVYFCSIKDDEPQQINNKLDELSALWCDQEELGKCKYEMIDDVGNIFATDKFKEEFKNEPITIKSVYADEGIFLSLKTYALRSKYTGKEFMRANGVAKWVIEKIDNQEEHQRDLQRAKWNQNDEQITFDNFIDVYYKEDSLKFNVIQFSTQKKYLADEQKTIINEGKFQQKSKTCQYDQKVVTKSGKCIPKIHGGQDEIHKPLIYELEEDYMIFNTFEEIKTFFKMEQEEQFESFKEQVYIIRNEKTNQFYLFKNRESIVTFFNETIKPNPEKIWHFVNCAGKQLLQFDVDIKDKYLKYVQSVEMDTSAEAFERELRKMFRLDDSVKCEVIDRCRKEKISYHIRFNICSDKLTIRHLLQNPNQYALYVDTNIYQAQLRMTQQSDEFIVNNLKLNHKFNLNPKEQKSLDSYIARNTKPKQQAEKACKVKLDSNDIKKSVEEFLKSKDLQNKLKFAKCETKGKDTIIRLTHNRNTPIFCAKCNKDHENDNCMFIKISYNGTTKKQQMDLCCFKPKSN